ncbi:alcohol dehydrogenase [Azospirillum sp. TSH100]|uniref:quinone oxidoreductase family protein n=1 Tax=Azospirillum sp. TSH100 TaxID=652764 RepID=UPI000D60F7C6|nr:quinone oxidoreductase [Azospirillum sp. TSH100]PWC85190.1 alcohol dehydrogenase [Azospirillum sp. TSH100]QCG88896.1 quinone oxidoreductase [Azospirillum sp. TSH100]
MIRSIQMTGPGGAEVMQPTLVDLPAPGEGEIRLRHDAVGVNFVDIYHRTGLYPLPAYPATLGVEAAGVVEAIGPGVQGLAVGDRVAWAGLPAGGYAEARLLAAARAVRLPDGVEPVTAASLLLRGITVHMLLNRVCTVGPGSTILVHAAAGGLGLLLTQWAKSLGATVIGTVGSTAKAETARAHGLDHAILYREEDFVSAVRDLTGGRGVDIAVDGIGGDTLRRTFDAVRLFGTVASVGQAGGPVTPLELSELGPRRSLCLARPSVFAYMADAATYRTAAEEVLSRAARGLSAGPVTCLPLDAAAEAHRALEGRGTSGVLVLRPD